MKNWLSAKFPEAVLKEAQEVVKFDPGPRLDLRKKFIFTCDPMSARDYDDALSLEVDRKGNRTLGVHIADVSHFVRPGSALDKEAYRRSTSVYLCDRVIPMLPEALSNGVCSLVPNEDRLAFSVFMTFDKTGEMVKREFKKSIIRSRIRFAYEEVMSIISGSKAAQEKLKPKELKTILALHSLAQELRAKRFALGALDLEVPEVEVVLDDRGEMVGITSRPYDESHQMIEECMVAANEAVAKELWTKGIKILARYHGAPDPEKIMTLRTELRGLGVKLGNIENPKVLSQFLKSIKKHPLQSTISMMVLRSMKRAVYDSTEIGHYGLAKKFYAHFTSPIRRYPDLTLHRQLANYLEKEKSAKIPPKLLAKWAEHTSEAEYEATEIERDYLEEKKYRYLEESLNSRTLVDYEAVISKCAPFGCFVELPELAISGLIHISSLSNKFVKFNPSDATLSAYGGGSWKIGDKIKVRLARVDFRERKIDFVPVRDERRSGKGRGKKWNSRFS
ncbi:MAG: VacB/RNase II family 3'-5' exoribonuclease [Kiritimatiellae bacterium]|nr:VacB/RNase II family 3'-5' exoribonuclease [Kiritimatiellia bacterium]